MQLIEILNLILSEKVVGTWVWITIQKLIFKTKIIIKINKILYTLTTRYEIRS